MTPAQFASRVRRRTGTTSATYTDADLLSDLNTFKDEIAGQIQQVRPYVWNVPATFDLEADQREYGFPSDVLNNIVSLELQFDTEHDFVLATSLKQAPTHALSEDAITGRYSNDNPFYFLRRKALYILSGAIEDKSDGGKLVYNAFPADISSLASSTDMSIDPSTTTHGFPREFHELLERRCSIAYKGINSMPLTADEQSYKIDLETAIENFSTADLSTDEIGEVSAPADYQHGYAL